MKITKEECEKLAEEMQEIILRVFKKDGSGLERLHTESEQKRLEEISQILKDCEIIG